MDKALRAYGYVPLKPPSRLVQVGSLIWLSEKDPAVAGIICGSEKTMGADFVPTESPTANTEISRAVKRGVSFKVSVESFSSGSVDASQIKDVSLSIKDAKIFSLSDYEISERSNLHDDRCLRALQRRQRANFNAEIVSSALMASAVYHVRWSSSSDLSVQAKIAQLEMVAAQLGLNASTVTDKTISADNLVLGIRTDSFQTYLYSPQHVEKADRRQSALPSAWDGFFVDKEDAESTTSRGQSPTVADDSAEDEYWQQLDVTQD